MFYENIFVIVIFIQKCVYDHKQNITIRHFWVVTIREEYSTKSIARFMRTKQ